MKETHRIRVVSMGLANLSTTVTDVQRPNFYYIPYYYVAAEDGVDSLLRLSNVDKEQENTAISVFLEDGTFLGAVGVGLPVNGSVVINAKDLEPGIVTKTAMNPGDILSGGYSNWSLLVISIQKLNVMNLHRVK